MIDLERLEKDRADLIKQGSALAQRIRQQQERLVQIQGMVKYITAWLEPDEEPTDDKDDS